MNSISAIRQYISQLPGAAAAPRPPTAIPAGELQGLSAGQALSPTQANQADPTSFGQMLGQMVQDVSAKQGEAAQAVQDLQAGNNVSLHQAMIAMEEASVSFQLMVEVRNKLLESYQEIMRMQV
jgi:flagellar hook-basal body complex protein FliE